MEVVLHQALYGYDAGHRRLASSIKLGKEADRILRSITDLKVGSVDRSYLTIAPIPTDHLHAFVKTWSAGSGFRPGSVWSHVLLVSEADLKVMESFDAVLDAFERPGADSPADLPAVRNAYSVQITLPAASRPAMPSPPTSEVAALIVASAYGAKPDTEIVVERASDCEWLLVELMAQAWPELRQSLAVRTRHRRGSSSMASFAVEVVERPSAQASAPDDPTAAWVARLASDLLRPDLELRRWLHRYGADAGAEPTVAKLLTEVHEEVRAGRAAVVLDRVAAQLPTPSDLPRLKRALFGPFVAEEPLLGWPSDEVQRLEMALRLTAALDAEDLRLTPRLVELVHEDDAAAVRLAVSAAWDDVPPQIGGAYFLELSRELPPAELVSVAVARPEAATKLLRERPEAWSQSALWKGDMARTVADLVIGASDESQRITFVELAMSGEEEGAGLLVDRRPELWWSLVDERYARRITDSGPIAKVARQLLAVARLERLGPPTVPLSSPDQLRALVAVAPPEMKLWKLADPGVWMDLAQSPIDDGSQRVAAMAGALASAERSKDLQKRERAWLATFAYLHQALEGSGPPATAERALDRALPGGASWDWCGRLREGLSRVAVEAGWSASQIQEEARGAGQFADDVMRRVHARHEGEQGPFHRLFRSFWS